MWRRTNFNFHHVHYSCNYPILFWTSCLTLRKPTKNAQGGWYHHPWNFAFPTEVFENISHGYVFGVKGSNGDKEKILSLLHNLENQGQTPFCTTFHICGCKHDTKLILVSILTFWRSRISKMLKTITWFWRLTLELKVTHIHFMTFISSGCMHDGLGVESNIVNVEDLRKPIISHLTLMFDLENLGQTLFCMTFHISGCKHDTKSMLVSIVTHSRSIIEDIKNVAVGIIKNVTGEKRQEGTQSHPPGHPRVKTPLLGHRSSYKWIDLQRPKSKRVT